MRKFVYLLSAIGFLLLTKFTIDRLVVYNDELIETADRSNIKHFDGTIIDFVSVPSSDSTWHNEYQVQLENGDVISISVGGATREEVGLYVGDECDVYTEDFKTYSFTEEGIIISNRDSMIIFLFACFEGCVALIFGIQFICVIVSESKKGKKAKRKDRRIL